MTEDELQRYRDDPVAFANEVLGVPVEAWDHLTDTNQWYLLNQNNLIQHVRPQQIFVPPAMREVAEEILGSQGRNTMAPDETNMDEVTYAHNATGSSVRIAVDTAAPAGEANIGIVMDEVGEFDEGVMENIQINEEGQMQRREGVVESAPQPDRNISAAQARQDVDTKIENNQNISLYLWENGIAILSKDLVISYLWQLFRHGYKLSSSGDTFLAPGLQVAPPLQEAQPFGTTLDQQSPGQPATPSMPWPNPSLPTPGNDDGRTGPAWVTSATAGTVDMSPAAFNDAVARINQEDESTARRAMIHEEDARQHERMAQERNAAEEARYREQMQALNRELAHRMSRPEFDSSEVDAWYRHQEHIIREEARARRNDVRNSPIEYRTHVDPDMGPGL